ncbi:MAG TPA: hypothetical protein VLV76_03335 [Candidatus Acidoferrum sp.]|nr:hypothetical protein [Candidatus Acidoferrum sp.]
MSTPKVLVLTIATAAAILAQMGDVEAGSRRFFHSSRGEHYDTVMANYIRRCTDLSNQFERARAEFAPSQQLAQASALYDAGVAHCAGGARLQGIDELTAAIRQLGVIPRVTL